MRAPEGGYLLEDVVQALEMLLQEHNTANLRSLLVAIVEYLESQEKPTEEPTG